MAVSTERDPVALRARPRPTGWARRPAPTAVEVGERHHPGPVGLLQRDAALRGHLGRRGPPARDPGRAHGPHRLPGHRLRRPGAGDAGAARRGDACPCPRCAGSRRTPIDPRRPVRVHAPGRRARCPPTTPATTARAGCRRSTTAGQRRVWESGLDTMAAHPPARPRRARARLDRATSRPHEQLELDREYRTFACGDVPYPAVDRAFELLEASVPPADRPPGAVLGRLPHRQHDLRRRPAGRRGPRLGDGHGRRPRAGPRLVPAARPPPHDGLRRRRACPGSRRARSRSLAGRRPAGTRPTHLEWYELLGAARYASIMVRVMKLLD